MNKDQRAYLSKQISSVFQKQKESLENEEPQEPSLNNYLVAACLDGTIQLRTVDHIKHCIHDMVLRLGNSDVLIKGDDGRRYIRRKRYAVESSNTPVIQIAAEDMFVYPNSYVEAWDKFKTEHAAWKARMDELQAQFTTVDMKINIGSDAHLHTLIEQVDNLSDLKLISNTLTLTTPNRIDKQ